MKAGNTRQQPIQRDLKVRHAQLRSAQLNSKPAPLLMASKSFSLKTCSLE